MPDKRLRPFVQEHKHAILFVGGIAAAIVGTKIIKSQTTKDLAYMLPKRNNITYSIFSFFLR